MAAKKKVARNGKKRKDEDEDTDSPGILASMKPETIRGVIGVLLFVASILLALSSLGLAGVVGNKLYMGIYWLIGVGYWLVPVLLVAWAFSLFSNSYEENALRPVRTAGAILFFVSTLTMVGVLSPLSAGAVGTFIAEQCVRYLDRIATMVVLAGGIIVSLLLLFDSELWVLLFRKAMGLFRAAPETDEVLQEDVDLPEDVEDVEALQESVLPPEPEEELGAEEEPEDTLPGLTEKKQTRSKRSGKVAAPFVMPSEYIPPPLDLLEPDRGKPNVGDTKARANIIKKTLQHFRIPVEMDEITVGPTVTQYSLKPAAGVKLTKIVSLQSNLELALAASPIRIEAPIPGRSLVGIEVPNHSKATVGLADLLSSPEFTEETAPLVTALGRDIAGAAHYADIGRMPHLLVAGTTGSGKSVMMHTIITSLLYRNAPERLRLILIDPKRVELTLYDGIPHLLTPVITEAKKCILSLKWAAKEMDRRYNILQQHQVQSIGQYHEDVVGPAFAEYEKRKQKHEDLSDFPMPDAMPHIIVVIDELADIMSAYPRELEAVIVRLAQMSRAVGIHLILSTQRPEAKIITGLIKANIPTRIALKVNTLIDSRVVLDQSGAEKLLGYGDMLYLSGDMPKPRRMQSPLLTNKEVKKIAAFLKKHNDYTLEATIDFANGDSEHAQAGGGIPFDTLEEDDMRDELYSEIRAYVIQERKASTSLIQRRFKVGYGRAARIMDQLEEDGIISASDGSNRPREVLMGSGEAEIESGYDEPEGGELAHER